jgi:hypothetical protein
MGFNHMQFTSGQDAAAAGGKRRFCGTYFHLDRQTCGECSD